MELLSGLWEYVIPFLVMLTVLVFVHEMGHYYIARRNRVRVEVFSIGFGPEIFGWTDSRETRWKFSAIPLGGYVKMFGDANAASAGTAGTDAMSEDERAVAFYNKRLGQRTAIVAAGPLANYAFAVIALAALFSIYGQPFTTAAVRGVEPDSPAAAAGFQPGDTILSIDGSSVERFEDVQRTVTLQPDVPLRFVVERDGEEVALTATPTRVEVRDNLGNRHEIGRLGVRGGVMERVRYDPLTATWRAVKETVTFTVVTFQAIGGMFAGTQDPGQLRGPLGIAELSGQMAGIGLYSFVWFMAILSLNLCLINLLPIPMLDGGHLLFYFFEALRGRPLGEKAQEFGFRIGLALVLTLMLFVTWNDLVHLFTSG